MFRLDGSVGQTLLAPSDLGQIVNYESDVDVLLGYNSDVCMNSTLLSGWWLLLLLLSMLLLCVHRRKRWPMWDRLTMIRPSWSIWTRTLSYTFHSERGKSAAMRRYNTKRCHKNKFYKQIYFVFNAFTLFKGVWRGHARCPPVLLWRRHRRRGHISPTGGHAVGHPIQIRSRQIDAASSDAFHSKNL